MSELLLEIFCEEIPSGMQARAGIELQRLVGDGLKEAGLEFKTARNFAGARRLTLVIEGLPDKSPDVSDERKGPRVGSPDKAIEGFLRAVGLKSADEAKIVTDEKKGNYYVAIIEKPGRETSDVLAELIPAVIRQFPWPKSQRWGAGKLRWVRPLHSILCLLGGKVVAFDVDGITSGNETLGHRFLNEGAITVSNFDDYEKRLRDAHVILDADERQKLILEGANAAAKEASLELVEDEALLREAAGLVEWPVVLMGAFDKEFLDVPPEVIITAIKKHQKCFSLRDGKTGELANKFILVSNLIADDGGKAIIAGNERVVRARLSDAKFFWDQDCKIKLEDRLPALESIIFHEKLGTQAERVERLKVLARELAPAVSADPDKAERAAELCKADLVTDMVGEFPDLQGLMGKYYALDQGEDASVAAAIEGHYKPAGQRDTVPNDPVSIAVALADKLDTLVGFWAINEKPTGSKDPYALRRAALGVIRIILENSGPTIYLQAWLEEQIGKLGKADASGRWIWGYDPLSEISDLDKGLVESPQTRVGSPTRIASDLVAFFQDRLKVYLRDKGARHDLVDAVVTEDADDLLLIERRVNALHNFIDSEDGGNLLIGVRRAISILSAEEKKSGEPIVGIADPEIFETDEERAVWNAYGEMWTDVEIGLNTKKIEDALMALAKLRSPIDAFFDHVTVNADNHALRENRLKLLNQIREATLAVADFSKIEG